MSYIDPPQKLLYHVDRIAAIGRGEHPSPVNVEIDLSNRCNLGCKDCHFAYTHTKGPFAATHTADVGDLMDTDLLVGKILPELTAAGVRSIVWSGGGEPTLHPSYERIITACQLPQGMYTNGTRIDEPKAKLIRDRLEWVVVSMDYANEADYRKYKGPFYYHAANGLYTLAHAKGNATVGASFLISGDNWREGQSMIDMAEAAHADYVTFRPMVTFDSAHPNQRTGDVSWMSDFISWLKLVEAHAGIRIETDPGRFEMYQNWAGHPYSVCRWVQMQTVITPDAQVWLCCNRRGFEGSALGNLTSESFNDVWERSGPFMVNDQCRVLCRGHIPNMTLTNMLDNPGATHKEFI